MNKLVYIIILLSVFSSCGSSKKILSENKINNIEKVVELQDSSKTKKTEIKEEAVKETKKTITKKIVYDTNSNIDSISNKPRVLSETIIEEIYEKESNSKENNQTDSDIISKKNKKEKDNSAIYISKKEESNNISMFDQLRKLIISICVLFVIYIIYKLSRFFRK